METRGGVRTIAGPVRAWIEWALDLPLWVAVEYHIHTLIHTPLLLLPILGLSMFNE